MKKNLVIILALGLFLVSCQNSGKQPDAKTGTSAKKLSAQLSPSHILCTSYSIFNPHGPLGATVLYSYLDCDGGMQAGSVEPLGTVIVLAQQGSVKCPGGVVTESGISPKTGSVVNPKTGSGVNPNTGPAQSKP